MLLAAALMWGLHRWLPLGQLIATPWNYLGAIPVVIGRAISVAAGTSFRQARTTFDPFKPRETSSLVTAGVFQVSRHPMYLGMVLLADRVGAVARHGKSLASPAVVRDLHICRAHRS